MNNRFEKIEDFINGALSPEDTLAFKEELKKDKELAMEVEMHRLEKEAMNLLRENDLKSKFNSWKKDLSQNNSIEQKNEKAPAKKPSNTGKQRSLVSRFMIAASFLLIIIAGGLYIKSNQYSPQALFAQSFEIPVSNSVLKGGGTNKSILAEGIAKYEEGNYNAAIDAFKQISREQTAFEEAQLFLGHTLLLRAIQSSSQTDFNAAIKQYEMVIIMGESREIINAAEWYTVLIKLKIGTADIELTQKLKEIANDNDHDFSGKANLLLSQMNSKWFKWRF